MNILEYIQRKQVNYTRIKYRGLMHNLELKIYIGKTLFPNLTFYEFYFI